MASLDNTATAAAQTVPEENVAADVATATTAAMAPTAATAPATATAANTASANDAEASSSQAAADLAVTFPLPSLAAAEATVDAGAVVITETCAATNNELLAEEENLAERSRYWLPSDVTEDYLTELVDGGFLPTKAECSWRAPGDETVPTPQGDERVILVSHLLRGMTLPPSAFFSSVLEYYGLQPHNIAPNSILVLAGF